MSERPYLIVETIGNVENVERKDEHHRIRDASAATGPLLAGHADINKGPQDEARTKFVEGLDVKRAN